MTSSSIINAMEKGEDKKGKDNLATILKTFKLFTKDVVQDLQNIANKDIVNTDLKEDVLIAHKKWQ